MDELDKTPKREIRFGVDDGMGRIGPPGCAFRVCPLRPVIQKKVAKFLKQNRFFHP